MKLIASLICSLAGHDPMTVHAGPFLQRTWKCTRCGDVQSLPGVPPPPRHSELKVLARLRGKLETLRTVHELDSCKDDECMVCGVLHCPHGDPLHFHHDGCPACVQDESAPEREAAVDSAAERRER